MSTASVSPTPTLPVSPSPSRRRPSAPSDQEHLIYQWVKLDGHSQSWVAEQFSISQSTVSRIVKRYERWQAHAEEREGGRLDHSERLRYQRWLTMECNNQILASCLRIAQNLEGFIDASRSTTLYAQQNPGDQTQVRTEHYVIDRTASVCRFLRLAHRISMDQLKLAQLAPPPVPNPLSPAELADLEHDAELIQAEFAAAKRRSAERRAEEEAERAQQQAELKRLQELELAEQLASSELPPDPSPTLNLEPETLNSSHSPTENFQLSNSNSTVHNLHNVCTPQIAATQGQPCTCAPPPSPKKKRKPSRITREGAAPAEPPYRPAPHEREHGHINHKPKRTSRRLAMAPK